MKLILLFSVLFFVMIENAVSQLDSVRETPFNTSINISAGLNLGVLSGSFFDVYKSELAGKKDAFSLSPNLAVGIKYLLTEQYRFGVVVEYTNASFSDSYIQTVKTPEGMATRTITQSMNQSIVPILFTAEIVPYTKKQFKSFYGLGGGIALNHLVWDELLHSNYPQDKRKGGNLYNDTYFSPALRIYVGVELGFDKNPYKFTLGSLIIEMRYTHFFSNVDVFEKIRNQFVEIPDGLNESQNLLNGYFSLNLALSFNLMLERKK